MEVKLRPQIPDTDVKVLGFNIGAQVARGSTVPAGRVCSLQATRLISSTGRPAVGSAAIPRSPGRPQPGLEAVAAVLHGQASLALYSIPITMNGTRSDCSHYMQQRPLPASAPAWVKVPRCPTHRLRGGDDGLPVPLVGRTRRVGGHLAVALSFKHCEI